MNPIESLRQMTLKAGESSEYQGYFYSISNILTIMVCGMLSSLQCVNDVYEWSKAAPVRKFLNERFGIGKIPCKAQFYNILACVDAEKFNLSYLMWQEPLLSRMLCIVRKSPASGITIFQAHH